MKVYVYYKDTDNSCGDPECCGGPFPCPSVKIFSSIEAAAKADIKVTDLREIVLDENVLVSLIY